MQLVAHASACTCTRDRAWLPPQAHPAACTAAAQAAAAAHLRHLHAAAVELGALAAACGSMQQRQQQRG